MPPITDDPTLRDLLTNARVIAVVGHSDDPSRASYQIAAYLRRAGYTIYAVNPTVTEIDGEPAYPSLADVPEPIDIVDVFRRSEHLPGVVEAAVAVGAGAVWAQLGVTHPDADRIADEAAMPLVMDRCIKVEHRRLGVKNQP
ncbi:MAG: CoA-binding protein [Anaerolineae bacterium]|nr:CoA-binding protein [Anaerolineae bacterium]